MKYLSVLPFLSFFLILVSRTDAQTDFRIHENFEKPFQFEKTGRGVCRVQGGKLVTRNAYASFGDTDWANYTVGFSARTPATASEVQIWAGFRASNRDDRYVVALKGGIQNDLYLARLGYMGTDDFLALRHLDVPLKTGTTYHLKIQVAGKRIRIFLNQESLPRIDIEDPNSGMTPAGKITLGGGWIETVFDHLTIQSLDAKALSGIPVQEYSSRVADKEKIRRMQRSAYKDVTVAAISKTRTEISLDGKWLFKPGYEIASERQAVMEPADENWHMMNVPDFWNPDHIWLFGEHYATASKGTSDSYYQKEADRCAAFTFDYRKTSTGWYRQWIELPKGITGKHLELCFDAVSKLAEVWINGHRAGSHAGMFGAFTIDATPWMKPGKNLLVVKVYRDYLKDSGNGDKVVGLAVSEEVTQKMLKDLPHGFYGNDPAGIWQPVTLVITNPLQIEDVFINPGLHGSNFQLTVKNHSTQGQDFSVSTDIIPAGEGKALYNGTSIKTAHLNPGEQKVFDYSIDGLQPKLWSPASPALYRFGFTLAGKGGKELDRKIIRSGFRTFEVKGDYFYLNGKPYWLRGADQTPMSLAPNDPALADTFCKLMHKGNIAVTRTHTAPYSEVWMNASDKDGVGVSFEGTWPWLMIGSNPVPDQKLLDIWKNEFFDLMKKYRNHPSLLMWTINNEMNFYRDDPDTTRAKTKMKIISDVVREMRRIDPSHPVCFASNYSRKETLKRFGKTFMKTIDDGDMDDIHSYPNWYNESIFSQFNGEFQARSKFKGRPLISQEMSTGYPDETGHPTRFYRFVHQTPAALVGKYAYAYNDPRYFLQSHAFITKELAEALRRSNENAAGILHFSLATWFRNVYLSRKITPLPVYYSMKKALQPVLVSAELWGRHFYAGSKLPVRICIVNDATDGKDLGETTLDWLLTDGNHILLKGTQSIAPVTYYGRKWIRPEITIPASLSQGKVNGKLVLRLSEKGRLLSENEYDLLFTTKKWAAGLEGLSGKKLVVVDPSRQVLPVLDFLHIKYTIASGIKEAFSRMADAYILEGIDSTRTTEDISEIKSAVETGRKVMLLNCGTLPEVLYPQYIRGIIPANREIVMMDVPESAVFDGIEPLETRYFNNNKREIPSVCSGAYQVNRSPGLETLASSVQVHGYLQGDMKARSSILDKLKGFPILRITDQKGAIIVSTMTLEKGTTDPIAGKLFTNLLAALLK